MVVTNAIKRVQC